MKKIFLFCVLSFVSNIVFGQGVEIKATIEEALRACSNCEICDESQWHHFAKKEVEIVKAEARLKLAKKNQEELLFNEVCRLKHEKNLIIMASVADWTGYSVEEVIFSPYSYMEQTENQHYLSYDMVVGHSEVYLNETKRSKERMRILTDIAKYQQRMDEILIHFFYLQMLKKQEERRIESEEYKKKYIEESKVGESTID